MPVAGLEPARLLNRLILSQVRLPIPPQRLILSDKKTFLSESAFFMLPYPVTFFNYFFMILFVFYLQSFFPTSKQSNVAK